jgi:HAD superfamily hydrolase (TIGR01509 family)
MKTNTIKVVIFDFNDVLSPSNYMQAFKRHEKSLGMSVDEFVDAYVSQGLLDKLLAGEYVSEYDFWQAVSELTGIDMAILTKLQTDVANSKELNPQVLQIIRQLRECYMLVLLTNNYRETFQYWIERFNLKFTFHAIFNSADYGILKSNPKLYRLVLNTLNVKANETVMIDDNTENLAIADSLGIKTIHYVGANKLRTALVELGLLELSCT